MYSNNDVFIQWRSYRGASKLPHWKISGQGEIWEIYWLQNWLQVFSKYILENTGRGRFRGSGPLLQPTFKKFGIFLLKCVKQLAYLRGKLSKILPGPAPFKFFWSTSGPLLSLCRDRLCLWFCHMIRILFWSWRSVIPQACMPDCFVFDSTWDTCR